MQLQNDPTENSEQESSHLSATAVFYGTRNGDYTKSQSPFLFHFADADEYAAHSAVKKLQKGIKAAGKDAEFHSSPGTRHWFFENDRPEAYNAQAAVPACRRTVEYLRSISNEQ